MKFDVVYSDEGNTENSGWYEICRATGLYTRDPAYSIEDSSEVRWEILGRTLGEDTFFFRRMDQMTNPKKSQRNVSGVN